MAFADRFRKKEIQAQVMPAIYDAPFGQFYGSYGFAGYNSYANSIQRAEAMSVPSIAQCRNLIAGTIASIPLEMFDTATGAEVQDAPPWVRQPDKRAPRSVTIAWLVDSLLMYGVGYLKVTEVYQEDGRPSRFEWVQNDRVSTKLNNYSTEVDYYMINGERVPDSGVGSLVTFQHLDQGLLFRGARTIKQAVNLENAASIAAETPMPSGYLKSSGADLPPEQVAGLLAQWKQSRLARSTAFLTQSLSYQPTQFSPAEMMYNDAIQGMALQICRLCNVDASYLSAQTMRSDTYSNILDKRKEFVAHTLQPYITAIETRLSLDDITSRGRVVKFAVDETFLRANPMDRLAVTEKMLQLNLITLDQAKQMEDLTPEGNTFDETND
jgi:HK97 family phage portal protein